MPSRTRKPSFVCVLLCLCCAFSQLAQAEEKKLELDEVLQNVQLYHPELQITDLKSEKARAELLKAKGNFAPKFMQRTLIEEFLKRDDETGELKRDDGYTFSGELSWQTPAALEIITGLRTSSRTLSDDALTYKHISSSWDSIKKSELPSWNNTETRVGLRLPLLRNLLIDPYRLQWQLAKLQSPLAHLAWQQKKAKLFRKASYSYWEWLAAYQSWQVKDELLSILRERQTWIENSAEAGLIPEMNIVDNRAQMANQQAQLAQAERKIEKTALKLSNYIWNGNELSGSLPNKEEASFLPEDAEGLPVWSKEDVFARRPELEGFRYWQQEAQLQERIAKNNILPKLDLEVLAVQDIEHLNDNSLQASLNMELPLIPWKARGEILAARVQIQELDLQQQLIRRQIEQEIADAMSALRRAEERWQNMEEAASQQAQVLEGERLKFRAGLSTLFTVYQRESSYLKVQEELIAAKAAYQQALADCYYALGLWID